MDLRSELLPPPVARQRLEEISGDIERIAGLVLRGASAEADDAVVDFNEKTGHKYAIHDFAEHYAGRNLSDFAREAARPAWPKAHDVTRDELVEIVSRILAGDPETAYYLRLLEVNVLHPQVSGLIFHPPTELLDASAESIVDAALSYRPIAL